MAGCSLGTRPAFEMGSREGKVEKANETAIIAVQRRTLRFAPKSQAMKKALSAPRPFGKSSSSRCADERARVHGSRGLQTMDSLIINAKDTVVVKNADDKSSCIVKLNGDQKIGKSRVNMKDTVGLPYASYFELAGRKFQRIREIVEQADGGECEGNTEAPEALAAAASQGDAPTATNLHALSDAQLRSYVAEILQKNAEVSGVRGDNSFYVDTNTAQKLTDADILKLREEGLSGEEIIKILMKNSDTFAYKTDFAQAKWIKRKEKKYRKKYQVMRCTPATVCEASFSKNKEKICNLRVDSLAQILSQSGIHSGCQVMIIESTVGMVTGAVAYRMRGRGRILSVYGGQQPHLDMARYFNLSHDSIQIIEPIPAVELGPAARSVAKEGFAEFADFPLPPRKSAASNASSAGDESSSGGERNAGTGAADSASSTNDLGDRAQASGKKRKHPTSSTSDALSVPDQLSSTGRTPESQTRLRSYLRQGVDHLIIASRYRPLPLLKAALYLLAPSSPFVIYHEFLEPLLDCYLYLQDSQLALRLVLSDTWMREFQTLPGRMRPDMFMSTSGGYLLCGIYVGMVPRPFLGEPSSSSSSSSEPLSSAT